MRERGFTVTVTLDTAARPVGAAEAERAERSQVRVGRLEQRAERLHGQADAAEQAAHRALDAIPLGQPMLVDTAGYGADRRRRERAVDNLRRAGQCERDARDNEAAAVAAAGHMAARHHPETVANRIRDIEATLRGIERRREQHRRRREAVAAGVDPAEIGLAQLAGEAAARLAEEKTHWQAQLAHWRQVRSAQIAAGHATDYSRSTVATGDLLLYRGTWYPVVRVNAKSVSVPSILGGDWTDTVRYSDLRDVVGAEDPRRDQLATAALANAIAMAAPAPPHAAWQALDPTR